jgi:succinate-semialdehyde dehydrogenase/glutarate-semialdehyde dehydrogenase
MSDLLSLHRADLLRTRAWLGGRWTATAATFPVHDPADGSLIAEVAEGDPALAAAATEAAVAAFPAWRATLTGARARLLRRWFDLITRHGEDLARLISREQGKPLAESRAEVAYGAAYIEWFAEEARRADGEVIAPPVAGRRLLTLREPVGVVAVITPWNFPLAMIARKLAPALAAGCAVVAKPAEDTPLTALALFALAEEAGFPPGVLNVVPASREATPAVCEAWLADPRVRKISFTGSTAVGRRLAAGSAETLKRLSLELGGDAPFLVFEDADLDAAVAGLIKAKFRNAGQACIAANRVLVQDSVHDAFCDKLLTAVSALTVGSASGGGADIGPLINARAVDKVLSLVAQAEAAGARRLTEGPVSLGGAFVAPTLLTEVTADMAVSCEEVFGPVVAVRRFGNEAEAIRIANDTPYGLAAYAYTRDQPRTWRLAEALEAGMVAINEGAISTEVAPFGGVKQSGYGREGSSHGLADYQSIKTLTLGGLAS